MALIAGRWPETAPRFFNWIHVVRRSALVGLRHAVLLGIKHRAVDSAYSEISSTRSELYPGQRTRHSSGSPEYLKKTGTWTQWFCRRSEPVMGLMWSGLLPKSAEASSVATSSSSPKII